MTRTADQIDKDVTSLVGRCHALELALLVLVRAMPETAAKSAGTDLANLVEQTRTAMLSTTLPDDALASFDRLMNAVRDHLADRAMGRP